MSYRIDYDFRTETLHLTLEGFWTPLTLAGFAAAMLAKATALRLRRRRFAILSDARAFPVQSAFVSAGFERIMQRGAEFHPGPIAIVVGSTLNKIQAERTLVFSRLRVFLAMGEARIWLDEQRAAPDR